MNKTYKITVLGCGSSAGVPSIEGGFGVCDANNPKNIRTRTSLLISIFHKNIETTYNILIDCSPDFKDQAIKNNIKHIDNILFTHKHADHIYGINDIRGINRLMKSTVEAYVNDDILDGIKGAFTYIFKPTNPYVSDIFYKPIINFHIIKDGDILNLNNIKVQVTKQQHGSISTLGYIIDNRIGYIPDFSEIDDKTLELYKGLDILLISCNSKKYHIAHMCYDDVLILINKIKPKQAFLVHMSAGLDYENILKELENSNKQVTIKPSYDGLIIEI